MSDVASRDANDVPTLLGVSSSDGVSPIKVYADPITHRLLVDSAGGGGVGAWSTPLEAPNGVRTAFTVTAEPTDVVSDGGMYFQNQGYTYAAFTINFTVPPSQYVRYR